jgi:hypothetical protein
VWIDVGLTAYQNRHRVDCAKRRGAPTPKRQRPRNDFTGQRSFSGTGSAKNGVKGCPKRQLLHRVQHVTVSRFFLARAVKCHEIYCPPPTHPSLSPFASTRSASCSAASGMMNSHLHAVSSVSSCSQQSQVEPKQTKKGISNGKPTRRVSICLVRRPEAALINQWTLYRLLMRQDTPSLYAFRGQAPNEARARIASTGYPGPY